MNPDGQILAICHAGKVLLWDLKTGKLARAIATEPDLDSESPVAIVAFNQDGSKLIGRDTQSTYIWNVRSGDRLHTLKEVGSYALATGSDGMIASRKAHHNVSIAIYKP